MLVAGLALPAAGITYGQEDDGQHPNVGAMLLVRERTDPATGETVTSIRRDCSGSLIDEQTFLTAGHCVAWMDGLNNPPEAYVTFEKKPPLWDAQAMQDIEPAQLVAPGALDRMSRHELTISQNPALEDGGTCFGDSGGPIFTTIAGEYVIGWGFGTTRCPSHGVRVFDLHDPGRPEHVATFADGASDPAVDGSWTEKVIVQSVAGQAFSGELAAVSLQRCRGEGHRGFGLYDVTDPADPQRLALVPTAANGSHELWLERRGNRAYVYTAVIRAEWATRSADDTPGPDKDFQIWDVTDPKNPTRVGQWGAWEELGVPPVAVDEHGVERRSHLHSVIGAVVGDRHLAYLSYWDTGTVILDVSDPANPTYLGRTRFAPDEEGNAHSAWLARGGSLLIQTDEDFSPGEADGLEQAWGYGRIFDVSDPTKPVQLSTVELPTTRNPNRPRPGAFTIHDPKVRGDTAHFSWYAEGVVMFDVSDPAAPRKIAQFLPPPADDPMGFFPPAAVNVWGVALHGEHVLASDQSSGLWVFTLEP